MFDLTKQEKLILIFLTATFISGLGISFYKKSKQGLELGVQLDKINASRAAADKFIAQQRLVNINSFKIDELTRLPGVGEKLAARIIAYHKMNGPFKSKEELMRVKGIGEKKFAQIKELITLK